MSASDSGTPTACVLIIGDEILSGRTQDANLKFFGERLAQLGIRLREARVIPDVPEVIVETVNACRGRYTYVFTTGGIGPTHDDITTEYVARAFNRRVIRHPEAEKKLRAYYGERTNDARLKMAEVPDGPGVDLIENNVTAAPGYRIENVFVLAGIPSIARAMFEAAVPHLVQGAPMLSGTVEGFVREGDIAAELASIQGRFPTVGIGSYPSMKEQRFFTSIVARSTDRAAIASVIAEVAEIMRAKNGEPVIAPLP
jgi:molybdenum cofactor synthesis domain-containing protein